MDELVVGEPVLAEGRGERVDELHIVFEPDDVEVRPRPSQHDARRPGTELDRARARFLDEGALVEPGPVRHEIIASWERSLSAGVDEVSWGTMLSEAQSELILGHWWQLAAATIFMAVFVTAFSLMTDALRDALDPKLRGLE